MSQAGSTEDRNSNGSCNELAAANSANTESCASTDDDEALSPTIRERKASTQRAEDGRAISKRRQLKLQQLEEELHSRQQFLRQKYGILLASQSDEDKEGLGIAADKSQAGEKQLDNSKEVNERRFDQPSAKPNFQASTSQTTATNCEQTEILQATRFTVSDNHNTLLFANSNLISTHVVDLTSAQLAARQSVPKDLPAFNGDPTEWPMFFSAFEHSTRVAGYSNEENMIRLQKCLHGKARDAVRNCLLLPCMVPDVIRTLKMYFGRPEHILNTLIESARKFSVPKNKLEVLIEYAFLIRNMCATIRASNLTNYLNSPTLMKELLEKLSSDTKLSWAMYSRAIKNPNLQDFSDWLYDIAEAACQVTTPVLTTMQDKKPERKEARFNAHSQATFGSTARLECPVRNEAHKLTNCKKFVALSTGEKWDIVKNKKLCCQCLGNHQRRCWFNKPCGVDGCVTKHHQFLHNSNKSHSNGPSSTVASSLNSHRNSSNISKLFFRILPVHLHGKNRTISTYAFMDDGSSLTLIDEKLANDLGEDGIQEPLCIRWTGDVTRYDENSRMLNLKISSIESKTKLYPLRDVHTVKDLNLAAETMLADEVKSAYSYLRDIPLHSFAGIIPKLIIGANNPNLSISLRIREGAWHEPIAIKTRLGWTLFGGNSSTQSGSLNLHKCNCNSDSEIHTLFKNYLSEDIMGIDFPKTVLISKEEERAMNILEKTCKFEKDHFVTGLLWQNDDQQLPESLPTAVSRMQCLKRKIAKDPQLATMLQQQIDNLINKGYATRLPREALEQKGEDLVLTYIYCTQST